MNQIVDEKAVSELNDVTNNCKEMGVFQFILETAIKSVIGKTEEKGIESLFSSGGTYLIQDYFSGLEDFEVISYLIIRDVKG